MSFDIPLKIFLGFVISFLITIYLVPLIIEVAFKLKILDNPDGNLKKHKNPTPYLGGLAVYIGFITSMALVFPFENSIFLFILGSTLLLFVGLIDDLVPMRPYQKFFGQMVATFCFLKAGLHLKENFFSYLPNVLISFFWILSVINAFNLVDVMDGLATTLAICASFTFLVITVIFQIYGVSIMLAALIGALVGFFIYNKPNAKIYLGDAGSLFIGGILATVPFMIPWGYYNIYGYLSPILILLIPLLEVGTLILVRTYKRIPFYYGSPDHFSIYLQKNGFSKWAVLFYVISISVILLILTVPFSLSLLPISVVITAFFALIIAWYTVLFFKKQ